VLVSQYQHKQLLPCHFQMCVSKCPDRFATYTDMQLQHTLSRSSWDYYRQFCKPGFNNPNKVVSFIAHMHTLHAQWNCNSKQAVALSVKSQLLVTTTCLCIIMCIIYIGAPIVVLLEAEGDCKLPHYIVQTNN